MVITNEGGGWMYWYSRSNVPWFSIEPTSGQLKKGESVKVATRFDDTSVEYGTHNGTLTILSNEKDEFCENKITVDDQSRFGIWVNTDVRENYSCRYDIELDLVKSDHSGVVVVPEQLDMNVHFGKKASPGYLSLLSVEQSLSYEVSARPVIEENCTDILSVSPAEATLTPLEPTSFAVSFKNQLDVLARRDGSSPANASAADTDARINFGNNEYVCRLFFKKLTDGEWAGDSKWVRVSVRALPGDPAPSTSVVEIGTPNATVASTASMVLVPHDGQGNRCSSAPTTLDGEAPLNVTFTITPTLASAASANMKLMSSLSNITNTNTSTAILPSASSLPQVMVLQATAKTLDAVYEASVENLALPVGTYTVEAMMKGKLVGSSASLNVSAFDCKTRYGSNRIDAREGLQCACGPGYFSDDACIAPNIEDCELCEKCPSGQFAIVGSGAGKNDCWLCPEGFDCRDGVSLRDTLLIKGYWRHSLEATTTRKCPAYISGEKICVGGVLGCRLGHEGPFCSQCAPGYGKKNDLCEPCRTGNKQWLDWLWIGLSISAVVTGCGFILRAKIRSKAQTRDGGSRRASILERKKAVSAFTSKVKIIINYVQTTALAGELRVQFDELMSYMLEVQDAVGNAGFWRMNAFNCRLYINYYLRYLVYALVPVAAVVLPVLVQVATYCYRRRKQKKEDAEAERQRSASKLKAGSDAAATASAPPEKEERTLRETISEAQYTVFTLLVISYTPVVRQAMGVFKCIQTGDGLVLNADMGVECLTPQHKAWMALGAIQLAVYGLGIPLGIAYLLRSANRRKDIDGGLANERTKAALGFVYEGYAPNCYAWECLVMLRKAVLAMVVTACKDSPFYQTFFSALLLQGYTYVHVQFRPFRHKLYRGDDTSCLTEDQKKDIKREKGLQSLETASLCVTTLTLSGAVMFFSHPPPSWSELARFYSGEESTVNAWDGVPTAVSIGLFVMNSLLILRFTYALFATAIEHRMVILKQFGRLKSPQMPQSASARVSTLAMAAANSLPSFRKPHLRQRKTAMENDVGKPGANGAHHLNGSSAPKADIEMMFDARSSLVTPNPAFDGFFSEAAHSSSSNGETGSIFPIVNPIAFDNNNDDRDGDDNDNDVGENNQSP